MSGRRAKRKRRRDRKAKTLHLELEYLELARGYDGPFRGAPEPTLLFGIYRVAREQIVLLKRRLIRLHATGKYPDRLEVDRALRARVPYESEARVLVLMAALEEDSSRGVQRLYAELEAADHLRAWTVDAHTPEPLSLVEWAHTASVEAPATTRVHLVIPDGDVRDLDLRDDWIGAALFQVEAGTSEERRVRFVSESGENDWTAVLAIRY